MQQVETSETSEHVEINLKSQNDNLMDCEPDAQQNMLNFIKNQRSESTRIKTNADVKRFLQFLATKGEKRKPVDIPPATLDVYIGHFIMDLRRKDNSQYEPSTITGFHR